MTLDEQLIKAVQGYCINNEKHKENIKEIDSLLKKGASANAVDYNWAHKPTVLLWAADEGKKEVVELLLEHGANINNGGREGEPTGTPLHRAIEKKHEEVAIFLIEKGADIHATDQWGSTPLHDAAYEGLGRLVELLLGKGARVDVRMIYDGSTPLCRAMHPKADPQTVRLLLEHGSDVNIQGNHGDTPISSYTTWEKPLESFFLLLLYGADVNRESEYIREEINNTPRLRNCITAFEEIKKMLNLDKLIEANIKRDEKVIAEYINDEAKGQELISEIKFIKEIYGSDEQLSFIPKCLSDVIEHITLKSHIDQKTGDVLKHLSLDAKVDTFLDKLRSACGSPNTSLTEAQSEATSSQSQSVS